VSGQAIAFLVAAILALDVVIFFGVIRPALRRRSAEARTAAQAELQGEIPVREGRVRSLGEESQGMTRVVGSGHLVVTEDAIVFAMAGPADTLRIPRDRVTGVEEARSHLGAWAGRRVLRVDFVRDDGRPDAIAFDVGRDRDAWMAALRGV
jgi:hypothetical protein